ncbi:MAG TPA: hypothetical protein ENN80_01535, partial [Candidatus Hydrogenedentes bacterium]|nr:hypothetical protein [Candidatus Hydrogenedentota bacterium]
MSDSTQHDRPAEGFSDPAKGQADFYGAMYAEQKFSPQAVASGQQIYKDLRFQRLSRVFESVLAFSLHDVGMGLGHYYEYLKKNFPDRKIAYSGSEVVEDFYDHCRRQYPECTFFLRDFSAEEIEESYDYVVFGGTFYH